MTIEPPITNTYDGKRLVTADDYLALKREVARLRLTAEEREQLRSLASRLCDFNMDDDADTLRALLERLP